MRKQLKGKIKLLSLLDASLMFFRQSICRRHSQSRFQWKAKMKAFMHRKACVITVMCRQDNGKYSSLPLILSTAALT